MTMKRIAIVLAALALCSFGLFADNQSPITQGEFATLLASNLKAPVPQGGWTADSAIQMLSGLGLNPISGAWESGTQLNEGNMVKILRSMGLAVYSTNPDAVVTKAKANSVFTTYDDFFQNWNLKTKTLQKVTTTHIDTGVAGTSAQSPAGFVPPASPVIP